MSINTLRMYEDFYQSEGVSNSPRFRAAYLRALNKSLADMNTVGFQDVSRIADLDESIDLDADDFQAHLEIGIKHHIQASGEWTKDTDPQSKANWREALSLIRTVVWKSDADATWEGAHGYAQSDE